MNPEFECVQTEYAFKAVKCAGITSIGVRGEDSVCGHSEKGSGEYMKLTVRFFSFACYEYLCHDGMIKT